MTDLAEELADEAKLLQYRYDAPAWQGCNRTRPDSGTPAVGLIRRVTWEGNGFLAASAGRSAVHMVRVRSRSRCSSPGTTC